MVTITVKIDDSCDMAVVNDGCGNCMEGNLWDFHNGCHGDDLPEYNNIGEYIEVLKNIHISKGEEVKVVRTKYEYESYNKTKLTLDIIRSYGFSERIYKPDWDDTAIVFITNNNLKLTGFTQINNTPCETTSLEGFDGCLYIETKEELDAMLSLSFEEVLHEIKRKNPKFPIEEHI